MATQALARATLLALLLVSTTALALTHESSLPQAGEQDVNARRLHVVQYHPYPDPRGDPWGFAEIDQNGSMEARYDAFWYPTAVFDGLETIEGATTYLETRQAWETALLDRSRNDAPARLGATIQRVGDDAEVHISWQAKTNLAIQNVTLRVVLYEDEVRFDGGNGVDLHRFVARTLVAAQRVTLDPDTTQDEAWTVPINASWDPDSLGVVVSLHNSRTASPLAEVGEVLQSATAAMHQTGPTIQNSRGVLLETLTATWCEACVFGDAVAEDLANLYGIPSSRVRDASWTYLRPVDASSLALAASLGVFVAAVVWRMERSRGGDES